MRTILYPGTFDPLTLGHLNLVIRAAKLFDKVVVAIANNTQKTPILTVKQRLNLAEAVFADIDNVTVISFSGLMVDLAHKVQAAAMLRGLRGAADFENELQLANMNYTVSSTVETVFLAPTSDYAFISSTIVREIIRVGGDISPFVPPQVSKYFAKKKRVK